MFYYFSNQCYIIAVSVFIFFSKIIYRLCSTICPLIIGQYVLQNIVIRRKLIAFFKRIAGYVSAEFRRKTKIITFLIRINVSLCQIINNTDIALLYSLEN